MFGWADDDPDREPVVVQVLRGLLAFDRIEENYRQEILDWAQKVVRDWEDFENPKDLRVALGLELPNRRRRKILTAEREQILAWAYVSAKKLAVPNPAEAVATRYATTARSVERAAQKWRRYTDVQEMMGCPFDEKASADKK